jgi:hypothetical protein
LAVYQVLESLNEGRYESRVGDLPQNPRTFVIRFRSLSRSLGRPPDNVPTEAAEVYRLLSDDSLSHEFGALFVWAKRLGLTYLVQELETAKDAAVVEWKEQASVSDGESSSEVTPAGLYVWLAPPPEESDLEPAKGR